MPEAYQLYNEIVLTFQRQQIEPRKLMKAASFCAQINFYHSEISTEYINGLLRSWKTENFSELNKS